MDCEEMRSVELNRGNQRRARENDLLIPGLPNEIGTLCIARVPRASHRIISGVCVSWRNLLHGREFSEVRRELLLAEEWLYLWTEVENAWRCFDPSLGKWSKLPAMPHDNRVVGSSGVATIDENIFVIGGFLSSDSNGESFPYVPSKIVSSFDARSYRWKKIADLNVARAECMTAIIGNQIYVFGGNIGRDTRTTESEVYDPVTNRWRLISAMMSPMTTWPTAVMGGKFHAQTWGRILDHVVYDPKGVMYDPKIDKWELVTNGLNGVWIHTTTVLDGKLYALGDYFVAGNLDDDEDDDYEPGMDQFIHVYDSDKDVWEMVKEVCEAESPMYLMGNVELVTICGKLCVVSVDSFRFGREERESTVGIIMVDVKKKESSGYPTCSITFRGEFELQCEDVHKYLVDKKCQVIAV